MLPTKDVQVTTPNQLEKFVRSTPSGTGCVYHRGFLMRDRERTSSRDSGSDYLVVAQIANLAMGFQNQGLIELVQRRHGYEDYEYIAIRTDRHAAPLSAPRLAA